MGAQALVQLTDLGVVWKTGADSIHAYVFSLTTGKPVPAAKLQLVSDENESLQESATDASGMAVVSAHTNASWLVVQQGEDLHAVDLRDQNLEPWWFESIRSEYYGTDYDGGPLRAALFMDRDVYRPGESAHVKIVARELAGAGLSVPAGATGVVQCFDARSKLSEAR